MKKQRTRSNTKSKNALPQAPEKVTRRGALRLLRNIAIAAPVLGVAGYFSVKSVEATICEADLTKIGKGLPSVVQIHDPNCSLCRTLQKQTRRALKSFAPETFQYLVANINTAEGSALAAKHRVPHVTLLMFDVDGNMVSTLRGPAPRDTIDAALAAHLGRV